MQQRVYLVLLSVFCILLLSTSLSETGQIIGLSFSGTPSQYICPGGKVVTSVSQCPSCGDGICEESESCGSCELDCGKCQITSNSVKYEFSKGTFSYEASVRKGNLIKLVNEPNQITDHPLPFVIKIPIEFSITASNIRTTDAFCRTQGSEIIPAKISINCNFPCEKQTESQSLIRKPVKGSVGEITISLKDQAENLSQGHYYCNVRLKSDNPYAEDSLMVHYYIS